MKKYNNNWDQMPLECFPNCYTDEGRVFVKNNPSIKQYILDIKFDKRSDFKKLSIKDQCKFISKFYNIIGEPHNVLRDFESILGDKIKRGIEKGY